MKTYLRHVMPITLAALAACGGNKLEVGNVEDAGLADAGGTADTNTGQLQCEYQGRLYNDGEARADACSCFCDGKTGTFVCTLLLCLNDAGVRDSGDANTGGDDAPIQCEHQGTLLSVDEYFPADDGCNKCSCNPALRQILCSLAMCTDENGKVGINKLLACSSRPWSKPISLGTILGVGKSPSTGTLYVVDQVDSTQRVFVSTPNSNLVLKRQRVAGSGISPDVMSFTTNGPDATTNLQIDTPAGQPKRMGVFAGPLKNKTFVIGQDGEELTMLADSEIANMFLVNLPITVVAEYMASTEDGNLLLVARPSDEWTYSDFHVFFGPASKMVERSVSNVSRARDGGSTRIEFDLNGTTVTASFAVVYIDAGVGFSPGPATLTVGAQVSALTRLSAPPADAFYVCKTP